MLDGRAEAHLIALSCSDPPEGRERWSLKLLADRLVELGYVESLSHETVRRTLKKRAQTPSQTPVGDPSHKERGPSSGGWRKFWTSTESPPTPCVRCRGLVLWLVRPLGNEQKHL